MKIIFTTAPTKEGPAIVKTLLNNRLIGCGNLLEGARSLYWWDGEIQDEKETVIFMETTEDLSNAALEMLYQIHPYDVPKIVLLNPEKVNQPYLEWLNSETQKL